MNAESPPLSWMSDASRPSDFMHNPLASTRPSATRRPFRALARLFIAVLIGVGGTLAWQYYGGAAVRAWAPSLGWLLPADLPGPAVTTPELQTELKPMALDLAILRRSVEQLATNQDQLARKQDQLAQGLALVQSAQQDINQKILAIAPAAPPAPKAVVHAPPPKSPQPSGQ